MQSTSRPCPVNRATIMFSALLPISLLRQKIEMTPPENDLNIVLPPIYKKLGISSSVIVIGFLAYVIEKNRIALFALTGQALSTWGVMLILIFIFGCALYRNVGWRERLTVVKNGPADSAARHWVVCCDDLVAIELLPAPSGNMSADAKKAAFGFGGERLRLCMREFSFVFGVGLSDRAAYDAIVQIESFCGRALLDGQR